jgi:hypothetical protein
MAWSVTSKLGIISKPYLYKWYVKLTVEYIRENRDRLADEFDEVLRESKNAAVRSRDTSAEIGTSAHDAIDRHITEWVRTDSRPRSAVEFLKAMCAEKGVEPRGEEIAGCRSYERFLDERELIPLVSEIRVWYEQCPKHRKKGCPPKSSCALDVFAGSVDAAFIWLRPRKGRVGESGVVDLAGNPHVRHDYIPQENGTWWCSACGREVDPVLILGDWKTSNSIDKKDDYAQQGCAYAEAIELAAEVKFDDVWVVRFDKECDEYEIRRVSDRAAAWQEFLAISRAFDERQKRGIGDSIVDFDSLLVPLEVKEITYI